MFDVGFSELVVCFLVALVVLGPQRLPEVARTLGRWTGRARSYVRTLTAELERESATGASFIREVREAGAALKSEVESAKGALDEAGKTAGGSERK